MKVNLSKADNVSIFSQDEHTLVLCPPTWKQQKRGWIPPGLEFRDSCGLPCRYRNITHVLWKGSPVLLTTGASHLSSPGNFLLAHIKKECAMDVLLACHIWHGFKLKCNLQCIHCQCLVLWVLSLLTRLSITGLKAFLSPTIEAPAC